MRKLNALNSVVVSPSFSGSYSLPVLTDNTLERSIKIQHNIFLLFEFRALSQPDPFCGYVPIAPGAATSGAFTSRYPRSFVPTLIVVGERDGQRSSQALT